MSGAGTELVFRSTEAGGGPVFDTFFAGYDRAFVLPDEKEDVDGLRAALDLNGGPEHERLRALYGPFREICIVAETPDGDLVGGANFIAMPARDAARTVTANLSYIYVVPEARRRGHLRRLVARVMATMADLFADADGPLHPLVFLEQNDPFRMSAEAYDRDTRFTGLDQLDRLRIWTRLGARIVDFPYVQPPLSDLQEADDALLYAVLGAGGTSLAPGLLRGHLAGFFGISVLKGAPLDSETSAKRQIDELNRLSRLEARIALLDAAPMLSRLRRLGDAAALLGAGVGDMRSAVRLFDEASASGEF
jgi:GNAT superfamily N-acetyltransferase